MQAPIVNPFKTRGITNHRVAISSRIREIRENLLWFFEDSIHGSVTPGGSENSPRRHPRDPSPEGFGPQGESGGPPRWIPRPSASSGQAFRGNGLNEAILRRALLG